MSQVPGRAVLTVCEVKHIAHPVDETNAAIFHGAFVVAYLLAAGFHLLCALNHYRDSGRDDH